MSDALNKKMRWTDIVRGAMSEMKDILAGSLSNEQKLAQIIARMESEVADKRATARRIGGRMRAIADPETKELESLEALKARRAKLVKFASQFIDSATGAPKRGSGPKLKAIQDEIKGLEPLIEAQQQTYDTYEGAYADAKASYQAALEGLDRTRGQGMAILEALEARKEAQAMVDATRDSSSVDTSFVDDLMGELNQAKAESRSDADLDADLDATNGFDIDAALRADEDATVDASLLAEFQAAAAQAA